MKEPGVFLAILIIIGVLSKFIHHYTIIIFMFGALCFCVGLLYGKKLGYAEGWNKRGRQDEKDAIKVTFT